MVTTLYDLMQGVVVSIYCLTSRDAEKISHLSVVEPDLESCVIKIRSNDKFVVIVSIYRPPAGNIGNFCARLLDILNDVSVRGFECVIAGDMNLNIMNYEREVLPVRSYVCDLISLNFLPVITCPTRFPTGNQHGSPSLVDHIWYNRLNVIFCGIILYDISDHLPNFIQIKNFTSNPSDNTKFVFRDHSSIYFDKFISEIANFDWNCQPIHEINTAVESFCNTIDQLYCKCFPLKTKFLSAKRLGNPWITSGLLTSIREKSKLYKLFKRGVVSKYFYNTYRNKVNELVRVAKRNYFSNSFDRFRNNSKKTWKLLRDLSGTNKIRKPIKSVIVDDETITDESSIAEHFADYFSTVATNIENDIPQSNNDPLRHIHTNINQSFFMFPVDSVELCNIVSSLKNTSYGKYSIPVKIFKKVIGYLSVHLAKLINISFCTGNFPNILKIATVTPIFKSGCKCSICNFRPISVLPLVSKIFEKTLCNRLVNYLNKFNILSSHQFGFRKRCSTSDGILDFVEKIYSCLEKGNHALGIFIDLKKAFDTISHKILLGKMQKYGIRGVALSLFDSYLKNRQFRVRVGDSISSVRTVNVGVPQGSVLGPILFLIYINDLPNISNDIHVTLFADDTSLIFTDGDYQKLILNANIQLDKLYSWTLDNRLQLNKDKTCAVLFTNRIHDVVTPLKLNIDNQHIDLFESVKFLGININFTIDFHPHINQMAIKLSKAVGILYKIRKCVPQNIMINLYYSLVYPYLIYCITVWGGTADSHLNPLILLQKKIIRIITNSSYLAHTAPLFQITEILTVKDLYSYFIGIHMFKLHINNNIQYPSHSIITRQRTNAIIGYQRISQTKKSLNYSGPIIWNKIPLSIRNCKSLSSFKTSFKSYLLKSSL